MVGKPGETGQNMSSTLVPSLIFAPLTVFTALDKLKSLKQMDKMLISRPKVPTVTAKPTKPERRQTSTFAPTTAGTRLHPQTHTSGNSSLDVC